MRTEAMDLAIKEGRRPTWEMALIYPDQGGWTADEYLTLDIGRHVDFADGFLEFQPMPDERHQAILFFLVRALKAFAEREGGKATMAPFSVLLWAEKYRQPDAAFMRTEHVDRCQGKYWQGADLVMEVLSDSTRRIDLGTKLKEYARASIPEYWIVDPDAGKIMVLFLEGSEYQVHGEFMSGQTASSRLLPAFAIDVAATLEAK